MKIRKILLACTALATPRAFDNEPGWKMDGDKLAVDANGDPIYVDTSGAETAIKHDSISQRNREAQTNRKRAEAAEAELAKFTVDGKLLDPTVALKAVETLRNIDAKKLVDAGEIDKVRDDIKREFTVQLDEKDKALADRDGKINGMLIDGVFNASEFVRDRIAVPPDFFQAAMRSHFKVEDGKVTAYDRAGNRIMSKRSAGDYADANEALEILVDQHPQKDTILKAPDASGSGGGGGGGNRNTNARSMKRSDFEQLAPNKQAEVAKAASAGEMSIVD